MRIKLFPVLLFITIFATPRLRGALTERLTLSLAPDATKLFFGYGEDGKGMVLLGNDEISNILGVAALTESKPFFAWSPTSEYYVIGPFISKEQGVAAFLKKCTKKIWMLL